MLELELQLVRLLPDCLIQRCWLGVGPWEYNTTACRPEVTHVGSVILAPRVPMGSQLTLELENISNKAAISPGNGAP